MNAPVKVLLVEDSPSDGELLQEALQSAAPGRFAVVWVERLEEAQARLGSDSFDVLLLDLSLPDSTGLETFHRAMNQTRRLPVVVLTNLGDEETALEAARRGVQDYLVKGQADGRQIARAIRYAIERYRAEEALRQMEERLCQSQKLESLGVLAGGVAHDFNNLLTATLGNAELVLADVPPDSPAALPLQEIIKATQRAATLSRQMLAYSGKGRFTMGPVNVSELVRGAVRMLEASVSRNAQLRYELADALPSVLADAAQLRQALVNVVVNASEALGAKKGIITVATRILPCDRALLDAIQIDRRLPEGAYVCLEVEDTGCGMDRDTLARAFDPFFSTKFTGRGLGLAVVQGIVRGHQGTIQMESAPGRGTTVRILLSPLEVPTQPAWFPISVGQPPRGSGRILLVDDEEALRLVGQLLLERLGFSVLTAADGREALELFVARREEEIACVILDLTMPRMDGVETLRELRRLQPDVRVLLCSGYDEQHVTGKLQDLGPVSFLQKPYKMADLAAKLRLLLTGRVLASTP